MKKVESFVCGIEELIELCNYWQGVLKLQHWEVALGICRQSEFVQGTAQGECSYNCAIGRATIKVLDPIDYDDDVFPQDMEVTLVHELLHLHMAMFDDSDNGTVTERDMERVVATLANSFVDLKREIKNDEEKGLQ